MNYFLIFIIFVGLLAIFYITIYNTLQFQKTKIESAENIINDSLRKKFDLLTTTIDVINKEIDDKKNYFKEYANLKDKQLTNFDLDRKLIEIENIINKLLLDNNLNNNVDIKTNLCEVKNINEKLESAKIYYNNNTSVLNNYIRKFPSLIIAKFHNFKIKYFYDGINNQDEITNDFKL